MFSEAANGLRHAVFDGYQRLFPLERISAPVTIVAIDEDALRRYGQWPWPRTRVAELVTRIAEHRPASIAFDLFFPEPDRFSPAAMAAEIPILTTALRRALEGMPSNDSILADAMRGRNVVLGISGEEALDTRFPTPPAATPIVRPADIDKSLRQYSGHIRSIDVIDAGAASRGLMNSGPADQVIRQVPLLASVQGTLVPALGVEALRVAVGAGLRLERVPGGTLRMRFDQVSADLQENGNTWLRIGPHAAQRYVQAHAVLERTVNPDMLRSKVVLVGITGLGVLDHKTTPLGDFIPGVEVHAQVVENLFNEVSLARPAHASRIEAAALVLCAFILIAFVPRLSALQGIHLAVGLVILLLGAGLILFHNFSLLFDPAWPSIGALAVFGTVVVGTLSEAERQRRQLREQAAHMAGEIDAARRIQMGLLPDAAGTMGHDKRLRIATLLEPARTVGGDFYDCFMVDPDRLFFLIADVSGKGLPAALFMAAVKSHIKAAAVRGGSVGDVLTHAQEEIERENPEQLFVTTFAARLDLQSGMVEFANAGHEPPFMRTPKGTAERMGADGGPPLCVVENYRYPTDRRQLVAGEWLVVVTDGATEAMNPRREFFGVDRLRTSLSWMPDPVDPAELVRRLREDVARFADGAEPADDITLVALRWEGPAPT